MKNSINRENIKNLITQVSNKLNVKNIILNSKLNIKNIEEVIKNTTFSVRENKTVIVGQLFSYALFITYGCALNIFLKLKSANKI
jgi:hypothetical protein